MKSGNIILTATITVFCAILFAACNGSGSGGKFKTKQCQAAAEEFARTWAASGVEAAISVMDSRGAPATGTTGMTRKTFEEYKVTKFDGGATADGEGNFTISDEMGVIPIYSFKVSLSGPLPDGTIQQTLFQIHVTKDTGKVVGLNPYQ